ncbi:hypothetical protein E2C01_052913 [Portunus trituberculatus]|uniref:Uncharacterized protein n=1 Tax=Portunus trituberculatus TaxID=210409 RepID=A0A5B7GIY9_PORTR|nr:hypothetical protein [Portunus trituberculatus]
MQGKRLPMEKKHLLASFKVLRLP